MHIITVLPPYEFKELEQTKNGIKYFFISEGKSNIIKVVHYMYSNNMNGRQVYNLGFGDYQIREDKIDDKVNTANGDVYKVFNTILCTIPLFFDKFPHSAIIVQGSDSNLDFQNDCKPTCSKRCTDICKNQHRRINAYNSFINKNYNHLIKYYNFYGGEHTPNGVVIEEFVQKKRYKIVLLTKNID